MPNADLISRVSSHLSISSWEAARILSDLWWEFYRDSWHNPEETERKLKKIGLTMDDFDSVWKGFNPDGGPV